jgi:HSP20 family protein
MTQLIPEPVKRSIGRLREDIHSALEHWMNRRNGDDNRDLSTFVSGPPVDIDDNGNEVTVVAEIPGFDEKDVKIEVEGNRLILRGRKQLEKEDRGNNYYRLARGVTEFTRVLPLPPGVDRDRVTAKYKNGLLRIVLPKTENARAKRVEVHAS